MSSLVSGGHAYQSRFWPMLNSMPDENAALAAPWGESKHPQSDRETTLLDVIGAYDLLLLHGLTAEKATSRLGLHKTRDQLVEELDLETAQRLSFQSQPPEAHA